MTNSIQIDYWKWFFQGGGHLPGYRRVVNRWLILHSLIGIGVALLVPLTLKDSANAVLLPLAGTLVGLSFAWAGNAQTLLESDEMDKISACHPGGFVEYVYTYQTAILTIIVTLVFWGLAGLNVFDQLPLGKWAYFGVKSFLLALSSLTLRECWHVVMGAQWMLILRKKIQQGKKKGSSSGA